MTGGVTRSACDRPRSPRPDARVHSSCCQTCVVPTSIAQLRADARDALRRARLDDPRAEADALLAALLDRTRGDLELAALLGRTVDASVAARIRTGIAQRARRVPLQHITGTAHVAELDLAVGPGVFVPRPETDVLIDVAVRELCADGRNHLEIADLGSGSGVIALGVAQRLAAHGVDAQVRAIEASPHAWPWLVRNVRAHAHGRVHPVFDRIGERALAGVAAYDALLSNPPYVPRANVPRDPEVRVHDPAMALYGGEDGLDVVRDLVRLGAARLRRGGLLLMEHDDHHGADIRDLLRDAGYRTVETHADLAGRDRVTGGRWGVADARDDTARRYP